MDKETLNFITHVLFWSLVWVPVGIIAFFTLFIAFLKVVSLL